MRTRDVTITVRCTEDERRKIRERAASRGLKLSDFVLRSALGKKIVVLDGFWEQSKQLKAERARELAAESKLKAVQNSDSITSAAIDTVGDVAALATLIEDSDEDEDKHYAHLDRKAGSF